jgi:hypothetical protein
MVAAKTLQRAADADSLAYEQRRIQQTHTLAHRVQEFIMQFIMSEQFDESTETIQTLEMQYREEGQETRVRMLSLLLDSSIVIGGF